MKLSDGSIQLSATDLSTEISCSYATQLNLRSSLGLQEVVASTNAHMAEVLQKRGIEHEERYIRHLREQGHEIVQLRDFEGDAEAKTRQAIKHRVPVIVQAHLSDGRWGGRADFLILKESEGTSWYEVYDTKLAQETKAGTVLQLCLYNDLLTQAQGIQAEQMHVVKPSREEDKDFKMESFRYDDFSAFYRRLKARVEALALPDQRDAIDEYYPDPCDHCQVCRWWSICNERRREDDHLQFVAGLAGSHKKELEQQGRSSLTEFADAPQALDKKPRRGSRETYEKLHAQAKIQLKGRKTGVPEYEVLEDAPQHFRTLPPKSRGDIYFDLEGDRFMEDGPMEYLFGWYSREDEAYHYHPRWIFSRAEEKAVFQEFINMVLERWEADPQMHIYHFAPYEPSAIKRLCTRYGVMEAEVDRLLRAKRFVDLHKITRRTVRASVERYSLKDLERFHGFEREADLRDLSEHKRRLEASLELGYIDDILQEDKDFVQKYNEDDCVSTFSLHEWLLKIQRGIPDAAYIEPEDSEGGASDAVNEYLEEAKRIFDSLTADLPEDWLENEEALTEAQRAQLILAYQLLYFRRESNVSWWEFFSRVDAEPEDLLDDRKAVYGLQFLEDIPAVGKERSRKSRLLFPKQEVSLSEGTKLFDPDQEGAAVGELIDITGNTLDVKFKGSYQGFPNSIIVNEEVPPGSVKDSHWHLANWIGQNGIDSDGPYRAARDLLLRYPARGCTRTDQSLRKPEESTVHAGVRLAQELDNGFLAIQGPPGTGKSFTGAHMIIELAKAGKKVGVTATSHKVILNLLEGVHYHSDGKVAIAHKGGDLPDFAEEIEKSSEAIEYLDDYVVGGTAWVWTRPEMDQQLDYLFVDEAGQMSLAFVFACARSTKNLVLLGDPQQLEQPQKGSHPGGSEIAALQHILGDRDTIADSDGLFLDRTWRMHPSITEFHSALYYDGRLESVEGCERQELEGTKGWDGSGLRYLPVEHSGNTHKSEEEAAAIKALVAEILQPDARWYDRQRGDWVSIGVQDIRIIAPYNSQVELLKETLGEQFLVGTVDKFQGQEAAVIVYSIVASSVEEAPRGMDFLFSPNRMNVAISRAKCLSILVASPNLMQADAKSPKQMRLANGMCLFGEKVGTR